MNATAENPFDSIESAHAFVVLLAATIREAKRDLQADIERETAQNLSRRIDALRVALYNLEKVELYMNLIESELWASDKQPGHVVGNLSCTTPPQPC